MYGVSLDLSFIKAKVKALGTPSFFNLNPFLLRNIVIHNISKYYTLRDLDKTLITIVGVGAMSKSFSITVRYKSIALKITNSGYSVAPSGGYFYTKIIKQGSGGQIGVSQGRPAFQRKGVLVRRVARSTWVKGRRTNLKVVYAPSMSQAFNNPLVITGIIKDVKLLILAHIGKRLPNVF